MVDKAFKVGCAIANYSKGKPYKTTLMCCNYAHKKHYGTPIYTVAKNRTGELCKKMSTNYGGLCAVGEYVNGNW